MAFRKYRYESLIEIADGVKSSRELALALGWPVKLVQKTMLKLGLPRRSVGPPSGEKNPAWVGGRTIDLDGYSLVRAPEGHPGVRVTGYILEHRLKMEEKIGRYLTSQEVVDHIDGNKLNNSPENLRLFATNGEHLRETLQGKKPVWSPEGHQNIKASMRQRQARPRVDTHDRNKKQGAIRQQGIARARDELDTNNPVHAEMLDYLKRNQKGS